MANNQEIQKKVEATKKKKSNLVVGSNGFCKILALYNNTIVTITNATGDVVSWSSAGVVGFKGAKKSTPFVASLVAEDATKKALSKGLKSVSIITNGPGNSKMNAIKSIKAAGLNVTSMRDITPIPHNGCRSRKKRRN